MSKFKNSPKTEKAIQEAFKELSEMDSEEFRKLIEGDIGDIGNILIEGGFILTLDEDDDSIEE